MKRILSNAVIFAAGAAIGSVVTWKLIEEKYKRIAQEEIDSVKEVFARKKVEPEVTEEPIKPTIDDVVKETGHVDYSSMVNKLGYVKDEEEGGSTMIDKPYVISPEEFGDCDYETVSLVFYADGVLADDYDEVVTDIGSTVGIGSLQTFGQYEDDSVFVRNDRLKTDYEILKDLRKYSDVVGPNRVDDNA